MILEVKTSALKAAGGCWSPPGFLHIFKYLALYRHGCVGMARCVGREWSVLKMNIKKTRRLAAEVKYQTAWEQNMISWPKYVNSLHVEMEIKTGLCGMRNNPSRSILHRSGEVWSFKMTLNKLFCSSVHLKFRSICPKAKFQGFVVLFKPEFMSNTKCVCVGRWPWAMRSEPEQRVWNARTSVRALSFTSGGLYAITPNLWMDLSVLTCTTKCFCKSI